jgi:hypothetical protein
MQLGGKPGWLKFSGRCRLLVSADDVNILGEKNTEALVIASKEIFRSIC